jgi:hypothetical protein
MELSTFDQPAQAGFLGTVTSSRAALQSTTRQQTNGRKNGLAVPSTVYHGF